MTTKYPSQTTRYAGMYSKMYRTGKRFTVPATGDRRRIQALRRIGYTTVAIAAGTGLSPDFIRTVSQGREIRIGLAAHKRIGVFYEEHSWHPRIDTQAKKAATYAKKWGWAPPGAWDDIDSETDTPKGVLS